MAEKLSSDKELLSDDHFMTAEGGEGGFIIIISKNHAILERAIAGESRVEDVSRTGGIERSPVIACQCAGTSNAVDDCLVKQTSLGYGDSHYTDAQAQASTKLTPLQLTKRICARAANAVLNQLG